MVSSLFERFLLFNSRFQSLPGCVVRNRRAGFSRMLSTKHNVRFVYALLVLSRYLDHGWMAFQFIIFTLKYACSKEARNKKKEWTVSQARSSIHKIVKR